MDLGRTFFLIGIRCRIMRIRKDHLLLLMTGHFSVTVSCVTKYFLGRGLSADVVGENMKRRRNKGENMNEKGEIKKQRLRRNPSLKGKINAKSVCEEYILMHYVGGGGEEKKHLRSGGGEDDGF
jgi:hypothetical protein